MLNTEMSAAKDGMKLANQAQELTEKMEDGVITAPAAQDKVQGGAKAVQFQRKFDARSQYDDEMNQKMQLMDKDTGMTPFGQVYYDDKVGRWLERKQAAVEAADFDAYFNKNFNVNDLAGRQWAQGIHPDFYKVREQEMSERADTVLKLKKIQLRGPQNEEDLHMLYLIESGRVQLPKDWDRIGAAYSGDKLDHDQQVAEERKLKSQLIRFPKFLTETQRGTRAEQNSTGGAWGDKGAAKNFFGGSEPPEVLPARNNPLAKPGTGKEEGTMAFNFEKFLAKE
jgi:hypothetical protein